MIYHARRMVSVFAAGLLLALAATALAADPEIDGMLRSPVGKDWVTNGGNLNLKIPLKSQTGPKTLRREVDLAAFGRTAASAERATRHA